ncbi:tyrosine-protein phosphatase [Spongiibacter sp. KMU-158]|uniref:Tyrosine-protein phosphatase n=1 Tax=Spongiibacter pelagi TaxID=2760804 RepID=A0A927GUW6_9GAMM|nr:tyrosine-protein phosphatase [Spongiibacter pelagi]MBD2857765.1 tyrosine-protein phosphatase [Spongiibacter pelagi]
MMNTFTKSGAGFAGTLRSLTLAVGLGLTLSGGLSACSNTPSQAEVKEYNAALVASDERVMKLEGSSNFRDMGGYKTEDGQTVRRGMLFRSGAMTSLSDQDIAALNQLNFSAVVDLRSDDELELYPNRWVKTNSDIDYVQHSYSMMSMMGNAAKAATGPVDSREMMGKLYRHFPEQLQPQLKLYFAELLKTEGPVVVNCSAGQDRTGFSSAMILSVLGVPRQTILEDYLLSTQYRRPVNEMGDVELEEAAKTNSFAKMMLHYKKAGASQQPNPLYTEDGTPYLAFALEEIDSRWGSVEAYLEQAIGVSADDLAQLRKKYVM